MRKNYPKNYLDHKLSWEPILSLMLPFPGGRHAEGEGQLRVLPWSIASERCIFCAKTEFKRGVGLPLTLTRFLSP